MVAIFGVKRWAKKLFATFILTLPIVVICELLKFLPKSKETSLKWLTVAMPLLENRERLGRDKRERQERDKRETRERQERDKRETRERQERD